MALEATVGTLRRARVKVKAKVKEEKVERDLNVRIGMTIGTIPMVKTWEELPGGMTDPPRVSTSRTEADLKTGLTEIGPPLIPGTGQSPELKGPTPSQLDLLPEVMTLTPLINSRALNISGPGILLPLNI